jgi:hypothetical protein
MNKNLKNNVPSKMPKPSHSKSVDYEKMKVEKRSIPDRLFENGKGNARQLTCPFVLSSLPGRASVTRTMQSPYSVEVILYGGAEESQQEMFRPFS